MAQVRKNKQNSYSETLNQLQAIKAKNEKLKIQHSLTVDQLVLLQACDLNKFEEYLTARNWQYLNTSQRDDGRTEIIFVHNLISNNAAYYQVSYIFDETNTQDKVIAYQHDNNEIYRIAVNRLPLIGFKNDGTITKDGALVKTFLNSATKKHFVINVRSENSVYGKKTTYTMFPMDVPEDDTH
ncbi:hypothetical protein [Spirosoma pomorum]